MSDHCSSIVANLLETRKTVFDIEQVFIVNEINIRMMMDVLLSGSVQVWDSHIQELEDKLEKSSQTHQGLKVAINTWVNPSFIREIIRNSAIENYTSMMTNLYGLMDRHKVYRRNLKMLIDRLQRKS